VKPNKSPKPSTPNVPYSPAPVPPPTPTPVNTTKYPPSSSSSGSNRSFLPHIPTGVIIAVPVVIALIIIIIVAIVINSKSRSKKRANAELAAGSRVMMTPPPPAGPNSPSMPYQTFYPMGPSSEYPVVSSSPAEAPPAYFDSSPSASYSAKDAPEKQ